MATLKCRLCNFEWSDLEFCPTLPDHDCSEFQSKLSKQFFDKTLPLATRIVQCLNLVGKASLRELRQHCGSCPHSYEEHLSRLQALGFVQVVDGEYVLNRSSAAMQYTTPTTPLARIVDTSLPTMVVIAGSGRTGTSCIAGILIKLGISMGKRFLPADSNNKTGYWEDRKLRAYLQRTFGVRGVPSNSYEDRLAWFIEYSRSRIEQRVVGCKHPSLSFVLPEMAVVWNDLRVICTDRSENDVKESLQVAHWWSRHRCPVKEYSTRRDESINRLGLSAIHIDFDDLLSNPRKIVDEIISFAGISPTEDQRSQAINHVDPNLRHSSLPKLTQIPVVKSCLEPVDVIYPLSNGSVWDDNELRYSLRSLEKYATNLGRVFVVGRKPTWLTNVVHIPAQDKFKQNKDANIIDKVRKAIAYGVSRRFIFASDDQFLTSETDLQQLPVTRGEYSPSTGAHKRWWDRVQHTFEFLSSLGRPNIFYDTHLFQPYFAEDFEEAVSQTPYHDGIGFTINTLAQNLIDGVQSVPAKYIRGRVLRGYGDEMLLDKEEFKSFLYDEFSFISRFELPHTPQDSPRVFTFWTGQKPPIIDLCLQSIAKNIPGSECWTLEQWAREYDGLYGPWKNIAHRRPNVQSDYLRYWLLNKYGGIWIDADCIVFRDVRDVYDPAVDYTGYYAHRGVHRSIPCTALMAMPKGSLVSTKQIEFASELLRGRHTIGNLAGPMCTQRALLACPDANIKSIPKKQVHPVFWQRSNNFTLLEKTDHYVFDPTAYCLMLVHPVIARYNDTSQEQLMSDPTIIGQALRKALS